MDNWLCLFYQIILVPRIFARSTECNLLQITTIADSMVMSLESGAQEETGEVRTEDNREPELTRPKITDREKELAAEASASYNSGDFSGCLATLEKLEVAVVLCNT